MAVLKLDSNTISMISLFKKITSVDAKDCFSAGNALIFITDVGKAGLAIGRAGVNIKELKKGFQKDIKIMECAGNVEQLIANFIFPSKADEIRIAEEGGEKKAEIIFSNSHDRRILLGNNKEKLMQLKELVKRYYPDVQDVLVPMNE